MRADVDVAELIVEAKQAGPIPLDLAFSCRGGEMVALFGPSGGGKTTVLRTISGLYQPASARVTLRGSVWTDTARGVFVPPHRRRCALMFQDYALFPHMTARQNILAAMSDQTPAAREARAAELLALTELIDFAERRPDQLSGGQRQRVALARAVARDPAVLLLDEPFSAIDRRVRVALYDQLARLRLAVSGPVVLVTHDFNEVVRLCDRLIVLDQGRIVAQGSVHELASRSDIPQLAAYFDPGAVMDVRVVEHSPQRQLTRLGFGAGELWAPLMAIPAGEQVRLRIPAREVTLALRPVADVSTHNCLAVTVAAIDASVDPALALIRLAVGEQFLLAQVTRDAVSRLQLSPGRAVYALVKSVAVLPRAT
jgi:molybdate transport system ATP-binding protein